MASYDVLGLPNELLVEILKHMPVSLLVNCRTLNRRMKLLIDGTPELQYKIELYLGGVLDTELRDSDIWNAVSELRKREDAWSKYKPNREVDIQVSEWLGSGWNIVASYSRTTPGSVEFRQITAEPLWDLPERWELPFDFSDSFHTLLIHPEVDLLVVASEPYAANIWLYSLSTGQPHPLAEIHVLNTSGADRGGRRGYTLTLAGRYLCAVDVFYTCYDISHIWVWNWQTGKLHLHTDYNRTDDHATLCATRVEFLNDHLLLVPVIEDNPNVYISGDAVAALYVYDCSQVLEGCVWYRDVPRVATFRFPPLVPGAEHTQNRCCSSEYYGTAQLAPHSPLVSDPAFRIFGFQINVASYFFEQDDLGGDQCLVRLLLFAHAASFLRFCHPDAPGAEIPWEQWAPYARLIVRQHVDPRLDDVDDELYMAAHGRRICVPEGRPDNLRSIVLYDFPPRRAFHHGATAGASVEPGPWEYVVEPNVIVRPTLLAGEVRSGLPFRRLNTGLVVPKNINAPPEEKYIYELMDDCVLSRDTLAGSTSEHWKVQMFA